MLKKVLLVIICYNVFSANAQNVGINATGAAGNSSAMLDVDATNKGLLIPRLALTALNAAAPVTSPANSLLVYNTATAGTTPNNVTPGYYYWNSSGSIWVRIADANTGDPSKDVWQDVDTTVQTLTMAKTGAVRGDSTKVVVTDGGKLGVGTASPTATLHTVSSGPVIFDRYGNGDILMVRKAKIGSTYNNYLGVNSYGIGLGQFVLTGHDGTNWDAAAGACIQAFTTQAWTTSNKGTGLKFYTTPNNTSARATAFVVNNIGQGVFADTLDKGPQEPTFIRPDAVDFVNARFSVSVTRPGSVEKGLYIRSVNSDAIIIDAPLSNTGSTSYLTWDATTKKVGITTGTPSDQRLKDNIVDTKHGLTDLMKIRVKDYEYKNKKGQVVNGFIAQDLHKIYPDAVHAGSDKTDASGKLSDPWTVDYGRVTPLIVKSVQEQQNEIDTLKKQVSDLQKQVELLLKEVSSSKK